MAVLSDASAVADVRQGRQAGAPAATRADGGRSGPPHRRGGPAHQIRAGLMTGAPFAGEGARATTALPGLPLRFSDPLRVLLCWAALLYREGSLDARLLSRAGVSAADLSAFADESAEALTELRRLRLAGALFGRAELGALLRARLGEMLMGATKPSELLALSKALERAPAWAWEEGEEGPRGEGQGPRAENQRPGASGQASAGADARAQWEALAGQARAEMARRAGALAQRDAGAQPEAEPEAIEWAQLERLGALLERCEAAALTGQAPRRVRNASYACGPGRQPSATKAKRKPRR